MTLTEFLGGDPHQFVALWAAYGLFVPALIITGWMAREEWRR